jgi:hypothetical protein
MTNNTPTPAPKLTPEQVEFQAKSAAARAVRDQKLAEQGMLTPPEGDVPANDPAAT